MSRILVTGGAGFIGSHLTERLCADGHDVVVLDDCSAGTGERVAMVEAFGARHIPDSVGPLCSKEWIPEVIFHLAAKARVQPSFEKPLDYIETNVMGTAAMLEVARVAGCPFIFAGSSTAIVPQLNPYAASKEMGEQLCELYCHAYSVMSAIVRLHSVYGPRQVEEGPQAMLMGKFERAHREGNPLVIFGDGSKRRDMTHVEDAVEAFVNVWERGYWIPGIDGKFRAPVYECGTSRNVSVSELAAMFGGKVEHRPGMPGERDETLADIGPLMRLGWEPKWTVEQYVSEVIGAGHRDGGSPV
jgi:UDP-glucose 4-epimerase